MILRPKGAGVRSLCSEFNSILFLSFRPDGDLGAWWISPRREFSTSILTHLWST
jgi:hypothetical protein